MKEFFESRRLSGTITLTLSNKRKWSVDKADLCAKIERTVERYISQGYKLTLRQLYYQLVAADYIPNDDVVYKKLSGILDDLRYSGRIDWNSIEDRGRVPKIPYYAESPADAIGDIIRQYRLDRMKDQNCVIEVWTEKDAISGILYRVTYDYHVRLVVNKGYSSSSAMHSAYNRFAKAINDGKPVKLLYFGDHDPSGLDMIRDIRERILFFLVKGEELNEDVFDGLRDWWEDSDHNIYDLVDEGLLDENTTKVLMSDMASYKEEDAFEVAQKMLYLKQTKFEVIPIGLTMEQIDEYNPPPNPAKITDPRAKWYIEQHGAVSYEVDALRPDVMDTIVRLEILNHLDKEKFDACLEAEKKHVEKMKAFAETFDADE